ncbi:MAG: hypothetical protein A2Z29_03950 [Chloroflexi bacterium RBG_16_56_11]|nr:MAG: hypothetical protein A2Z29_03950 [Chloroflexi bacterium RBG_16_56_11]
MSIFQSAALPKIIFILGVINLLSGLFILFTCRCIPGLKIAGKLMQNTTYKRVFKYHCYIWWVFWTSVVVHAVIAIGFAGFPF